MEKLKVLDLFSGLGSFSIGLEGTGGFETVAFCENDKDCQYVLEKHWLYTWITKDIVRLKFDPNCSDFRANGKGRLYDPGIGHIYGPIEVVCGGHPCTGHSVAGKKRGLKDEKSGLWKEFKRVLQEVMPKWVIIENSANLRTTGLTEVLQDLWEIGFHNIRWDILPAEAFGTLHKRERIYIIANSHSIRLSESPFTTTEKEQIRRAKAWVAFCNRECPEPSFCGLDDVIPKELERTRKRQVKQYGNALIPLIPQTLGEYILRLENAS